MISKTWILYLSKFIKIKLNSKEFINSRVESQDSVKCLYVGQREYATVRYDDKFIDVIGSDSATTCHILLLVDEGKM